MVHTFEVPFMKFSCIDCLFYRFEGISWNQEENMIAYVAEEPSRSRPTFNHLGFKIDGTSEKECNSWKGQGDWEEDWGETYSGKQKPALFVFDINRFLIYFFAIHDAFLGCIVVK